MEAVLAIVRDQIWQFIGAALAAVIAIAIYRLQRQPKEIAFGVMRRSALLTTKEELEGHIAVTYDGRPVTNIWLYELGLKNTGKQPIRAEDFERPLAASFGDGAVVLSAALLGQVPRDLAVEVSMSATEVTISPLLLNPRDTAAIKVLVTDAKTVSVRGRIVGVRDIQKPLRNAPSLSDKALMLLMLILAVGALTAVTDGLVSSEHLVPWYVWIPFAGLVAMCAFLLWIGRHALITGERYIYDPRVWGRD